MPQPRSAFRFQIGGVLEPDAVYVHRPADDEVVDRITRGAWCAILASRRSGKSSLRHRCSGVLGERGFRCVEVPLRERRGMGEAEVFRWISGRLHAGLALPGDPGASWGARPEPEPWARFGGWLSGQVLPAGAAPLVLFLDDLESAASDPTATSLLFGLRALFTARARDPALLRLGICVLGLGAPGTSPVDPEGRHLSCLEGIPIEDFDRRAASVLEPGLDGLGADPSALLDEVFAWTSGHPAMTLGLCAALVRQGPTQDLQAAERVGELAQQIFLRSGRVDEVSLATAARMLDPRRGASAARAALASYRCVLRGEPMPSRPDDADQVLLRRAGVVAERSDGSRAWLRPRNQIFARVLDLAWVRERTGDRLLSEPVERWIASGRRPDYLFGGEALQEARAWSRRQDRLTPDEQDFLHASLDASRDQEVQQRAAQKRRAIYLLMAVLVVGALLSIALWSMFDARTARRTAAHELGRSRDLRGLAEKRAKERDRAALEAGEQRALVEAERSRLAGARRIERGLRAMLLARQPGRRLDALAMALRTASGDHGPGEHAERADALPMLAALEEAVGALERSRPLGRHRGSVVAVAFEPSDLAVLSLGSDRSVRRWDARSGRVDEVARAEGKVWTELSPDGAWLASIGADGAVRVRGLRPGRHGQDPVDLAEGPYPLRLAFAPGSSRLAVLRGDRLVEVYSRVDGAWSLEHTLPAADRPLRAMAVAADGSWVAGIPEEPRPRLLLWNLDGCAGERTPGPELCPARLDPRTPTRPEAAGRRPEAAAPTAPTAPTASRLGAFVAFSPDGGAVALGSGRVVKLWDLPEMEPRLALRGRSGHLTSLGFGPDPKRGLLVASWSDGTARVWDSHSGAPVREVRIAAGETTATAPAFASDGTVVVGGTDGQVRLLPARPFAPTGHVKVESGLALGLVNPVDRRAMAVLRLPSDGFGPVLALADVPTGHVDKVALPGSGRILAASLSADLGTAVLREPKRVRLWQLPGRHPLAVLGGASGGAEPSAGATSVAMAPGGDRMSVGRADGSVAVWERDGDGAPRKIREIKAHGGPVTAVALSADGSLLISADGGGEIRLWDADTGAPISLLGRHRRAVQAAAFAPDARLAATVDAGGSLSVWVVRTGLRVLHRELGQRPARGVAFADGGLRVLVLRADGEVFAFDLRLDPLRRRACTLLRPFSRLHDAAEACEQLGDP